MARSLPPTEAYFGTDIPRPASPPPRTGPLDRWVPSFPQTTPRSLLGGMPVEPPGTSLSPSQNPEIGEVPALEQGITMQGDADPRISPFETVEASNSIAGVLRSFGYDQPEAMSLGEVAELLQRHAPDRQDLLNALGTVMQGVGAVGVEDPGMGVGAPPPPDQPPSGPGMQFTPDSPY